ncbi:beta family protein [Sphingomonas bacterium]|uniref:beta family protein n=1 Tax=Sphingomonas bacterium TaxID=1895847 RepID=UPI001576DA2E|nr:hypothetical protein [Sphingomonas bacterium]
MLQSAQYVSVLFSKRAEIKALKHLDKATRDRLFPVVGVRPWPNAKQLTAIEDRLADAFGGYRYGCDLDTAKRGFVNCHPAAEQFEALFQPENAFRNYYDFVASVQERVPVLRADGSGFTQIENQLGIATELGRGLVIRLQPNSGINLQDVLHTGLLVPDDVLFVVDAGWSLDVLSQEFWMSSRISEITDWDNSVDVVAMSSSFPNSFSHIDKKGHFLIDDRELFNRLVIRHNAAKLVYGDWGSTRLSEEQGGGTHYDRIDTARSNDWISYRQTDTDVGYAVLAQRAKDDAAWATLPDCWGKHVIDCTALDIPGKISGTESAIAARVNMHLTAQANLGLSVPVADEPYIDPF